MSQRATIAAATAFTLLAVACRTPASLDDPQPPQPFSPAQQSVVRKLLAEDVRRQHPELPPPTALADRTVRNMVVRRVGFRRHVLLIGG